jgi:hypothetical protein
MRVDPAKLADAAAAIYGCSNDLGGGLDGLQSTLTTESPWGSDEPGTLFGAAYVEILRYALSVYSSHAGLLADAGQALQGWAATMVRSDQAAVEAMSTVRAQTDH